MTRAGWLPVLGLAAACSAKDDHPPPPPECDPAEAACRPRPPGAILPPSGTGGTSSGPPTAGADAGGAATTELGGSVLVLDDSLFAGATRFPEPATVEAEGIDGPIVSASWDGISPFAISGYRASAETWFSVRPDAPASGALRSLHPVDTRDDRLEDLELVPSLAFDLVFQLLAIPDERRPGYGHVVLRFVDTGLADGIEGIGVSMPEASFVAYAVGGSFSDSESLTDRTGLVVLGNVLAPEFPGSTERVTLTGGASGFIELRVAADAVTLVEVLLGP